MAAQDKQPQLQPRAINGATQIWSLELIGDLSRVTEATGPAGRRNANPHFFSSFSKRSMPQLPRDATGELVSSKRMIVVLQS